jgi:hypothetical protein
VVRERLLDAGLRDALASRPARGGSGSRAAPRRAASGQVSIACAPRQQADRQRAASPSALGQLDPTEQRIPRPPSPRTSARGVKCFQTRARIERSRLTESSRCASVDKHFPTEPDVQGQAFSGPLLTRLFGRAPSAEADGRQKAVLDFIVERSPPTLREIGNPSGSAARTGERSPPLGEKGYLTREDMKSRTLRRRRTSARSRARHGLVRDGTA